MAWFYLILAGLFECVWAAAMKLSEGFAKPGYAILMIITMLLSFGLLNRAARALPLSIAYPVWTGIGAVGSVLLGAILFKDKISPVTWSFVILLIISIIGIKITSGE